jgi:hypothetical protein
LLRARIPNLPTDTVEPEVGFVQHPIGNTPQLIGIKSSMTEADKINLMRRSAD